LHAILEWLLDLDGIRLGRDAPLFLRFNSPIPAWLMFGIAIVAALVIVVIYRRERARTGSRITLALVRAALVALVVVVVCRPALILQRNRVEPAQVVLLIDNSRSMATADAYRDTVLASQIQRATGQDDFSELATHSRLELVRKGLLHEDAAALRDVLMQNQLKVCSFSNLLETLTIGAGEGDIEAIEEALNRIEADGLSTDIPGAIHAVLDGGRGRRLAAIVVASDGQSTGSALLEPVLEEARARRVPIMPIRFGSVLRPLDIEVGPARVESSVFLNDLVAIEVDIGATGLSEAKNLEVMLEDTQTGAVVASTEVLIPAEGGVGAVELRMKPDRVGRRRFVARVAPQESETSVTNNEVTVEINVLDDKLDVLYVEGYPRYEYRYLKNALLREKTISLSVLLLEADARFVQEGVDPIRAFPETPEALRKYDVIIFGDVDPRASWISEAQMRMLLDYVGNEGGGFALIAGERHAPHRFLGTPLEKLVPIKIDPSFLGTHESAMETGFQLHLTLPGRHSRMFRMAQSSFAEATPAKVGPVAEDKQDRFAVFENLPEMFWYARTLGPRPGATVLAEHPSASTSRGAIPLLITSRYGAGKTLFQATDDSWRWRRHTGELFHDAYWVQTVRDLMRGRTGKRDRRFVFRTDRRVYRFGEPVRAQVDIMDPLMLSLQPESIDINVSVPHEPRAGAASPSQKIAADQFKLHRIGEGASIFEGTYLPPGTGSLVLTANTLTTGADLKPAALGVHVREPDLEGRRPEANHEMLSLMAQSTGGKVVAMDELRETLATIPNRSILIPDDVVEPLWDSRLSMILFVLLIGTEWALRKVFGLL
jgi:hypothetical protein